MRPLQQPAGEPRAFRCGETLIAATCVSPAASPGQAGLANSPPRIHAFGLAASKQFWLAWTGAANAVYAVERTPELRQSFQAVVSNLPTSTPQNPFTDAVQFATAAYRLLATPYSPASNWF